MTGDGDDALMAKAQRARTNSYSPYSQFSVGAAVMTEGGTVYDGTNVENASYGLAMCAERVAIFRAIADGARKVVAIAVACPPTPHASSVMPCGACLQVIAEFAEGEIPIHIDRIGTFSLSELLPRPFRLTPHIK